MKVAITSIVALNPGDAAILQGSMRILQSAYSELDVVVLDRAGGTAGRYYPWARFLSALFPAGARTGLKGVISRSGYAHRVDQLEGMRFRVAAYVLRSAGPAATRLVSSAAERDTLQAYREADIVIASGGTYLVGHYNIRAPVLEYEAVLALRKPLVMFPQSMGPFTDGPWTRRLQRVLNRSECILVRDPVSAGYLAALGVERNVTVVPDAAFALAPDRWPDDQTTSGDGSGRRIAISVREWRHFSKDSAAQHALYLQAVAQLTETLVHDYAAEVTFVSTCQGIREYWTDDSTTALEIADRLTAETQRSVVVDRGFRQPAELVDLFRGFDAVVATRMHAAILALCAGTPVLPIAYEFKTHELFRSMGLGEWVVDIEECEHIATVAAEFLGQIGVIGRAQREAVLELRTKVYTIKDMLATLL